jgi:hypothetical protein
VDRLINVSRVGDGTFTAAAPEWISVIGVRHGGARQAWDTLKAVAEGIGL